jgi:hypothetical protein
MNLGAAWFGGMPMCHGAGGLAGQYRFGARTNGSILFLGVVKMVTAVLFGASLMSLCRAFPASVVTRDQAERTSAFTMLVTAGACLGLNNVALGFLIGLSLALLLRLRSFRLENPQKTT